MVTDMFNKSILVVDDEDEFRTTISTKIKKIVKNVYEAADGLAALKIVRSHLIDLILLDINIPSIDGLSLLKQIKVLNPDIVCIIISGYSGRENLLKALRNEAFDFLEKPLASGVLTRAVVRGLMKGETVKKSYIS